jgi:hypothetical protein
MKKRSLYGKLDENWLQGAALTQNEIQKFGKRVEKFTKGTVRTHSVLVKGEDIYEPLLIISIEIISEKRSKDIDAFRELIRDKEIKLIFTCCMGNSLEDLTSKFRSAIVEIKSLAKELLR